MSGAEKKKGVDPEKPGFTSGFPHSVYVGKSQILVSMLSSDFLL